MQEDTRSVQEKNNKDDGIPAARKHLHGFTTEEEFHLRIIPTWVLPKSDLENI